MGYDVHITRADSWLDSEECPITLEAWLEYARSDPEMRVDGRAEAQTGGNHAWFHLDNGRVDVKNPDAEILRKMWRVAEHFGACVQGDEGENYGPDGCPVGDDAKRPWWRRFLGR